MNTNSLALNKGYVFADLGKKVTTDTNARYYKHSLFVMQRLLCKSAM